MFVDGGQIEQVLVNLATNARDAMPRGGLLTIETGRHELDAAFVAAHGWGAPGRYAVLTVSDTGCGMDEETKNRIFEPFFTTKETGKGTGLGMSIVYGIVKQHRGFVNVYSEPGNGSVFKIFLPLTEEQATRRTSRRRRPSTARGGNETILVAEDEAAVRDLLATVLSDAGYRVVLAEDGQDAVREVRGGPGPDRSRPHGHDHAEEGRAGGVRGDPGAPAGGAGPLLERLLPRVHREPRRAWGRPRAPDEAGPPARPTPAARQIWTRDPLRPRRESRVFPASAPFRRLGLSPEPALAVLDAEAAEDVGHRGTFDHLRDDGLPEGVGDRDHRADEGAVRGVRVEVADEGAVDLHEVDGQRLEIGEGREAGPEVVEGEAAAELLQAARPALQARDVGDGRRLGDLEREGARRQAAVRRRGPRSPRGGRGRRGSSRRGSRTGVAPARPTGARRPCVTTQRSSAVISPNRSAAGRNAPGAISPPESSTSRTRTSSCSVSPVRSETIRWARSRRRSCAQGVSHARRPAAEVVHRAPAGGILAGT